MKQLRLSMLLLPLTLLSMGAGGAKLLATGDTFPDFQAKDQHEIGYQFLPGTKFVLVSFDMESAKSANKLLADQGTNFLDGHSAVYIANIYGMPGIGRFFAFPKLRKYPHRIILADAVDLLQPFPQQQSHLTVIRLNEYAVIESISFWNPEKESLQDYLQ